ncbi:MAG: RDD family protein [bacterium]|nr:RDD family protein [bacterium]
MDQWEDYETLRIETPEGLDLYLPLAGFGPRFLAFLLDMVAVSVVQGVLIFALIIVFAFSAFGAAAVGGGGDSFLLVFAVVLGIVVLITLAAPALYFIIFETLWSGQSPGKRAAGIRVIRRGGYPAGRREIVWRNVLRMVDYLPSNWMVGVVSFFATKNQQRIGDLVADTVVVREFAGRGPIGGQPQPSSPWQAGKAYEMPPEPGKLTPELAYIIGSYLSRAATFDVQLRERYSLRCIEALGYQGNHLTLMQREAYLTSIMNSGWSAR